MSAWRWRRCPRCGRVVRAGELIQVSYGANWRRGGVSERQCPNCGYRAATWAFKVVREKRNV